MHDQQNIKICALIWSIAKIILRCTVSKTSKKLPVLFSLTEVFNLKLSALELQDDLRNMRKKVVILRNLAL
jgi:hypothetical protein